MTTSKDRPTKVLDARGLLCPKPVMLTRDLVLNEEPAVCVVVDNEISATNVTRFLENASYKVTRRDREDCIEISAMLSAEGSAETMHEPREERKTQGKSSAFLMTSEYIGPHSDGLGELLMKSFLGTIAAADALPAVIAVKHLRLGDVGLLSCHARDTGRKFRLQRIRAMIIFGFGTISRRSTQIGRASCRERV